MGTNIGDFNIVGGRGLIQRLEMFIFGKVGVRVRVEWRLGEGLGVWGQIWGVLG